jgi:hypothetical protein
MVMRKGLKRKSTGCQDHQQSIKFGMEAPYSNKIFAGEPFFKEEGMESMYHTGV